MEPLQVKESDPLNGRPWSVQLEVGSLEQDIQKNGDSSKTDAGPGALRTAWGCYFFGFSDGSRLRSGDIEFCHAARMQYTLLHKRVPLSSTCAQRPSQGSKAGSCSFKPKWDLAAGKEVDMRWSQKVSGILGPGCKECCNI